VKFVLAGGIFMYSMKEACEKAGMTYETPKFYCNEGLVPNVKRDNNNYRVFDDKAINWLLSLSCLKKCGITIQEMKVYVNLCLQGESTIIERNKILEKQKETIIEKINDLNESVNYIVNKQKFYNEVLEGKIKYQSNLINVED
jgi:MerR family transcriptional regulator, aldehyde-responsive regulator